MNLRYTNDDSHRLLLRRRPLSLFLSSLAEFFPLSSLYTSHLSSVCVCKKKKDSGKEA